MKRARTAAPAPAATPAATPATDGAGDSNTAFASSPTAPGIADAPAPAEESLQALAARLAAARERPYHPAGKSSLAALRYFLIGVFVLAVALAWLYAE
jgi:hypothetical protein